MLTNSQPNQIRLAHNGDITWQKDPTNPLPGEKIGRIVKGDHLTAPKAVADENELVKAAGVDVVQGAIQEWLDAYVRSGLEPMFRLLEDDITAEPAKKIAQKIFDWVGILPREEVQEYIDQMDEAARQSLRSKKIRFGPLLVYLPELKKPAAVRMQALLLTIWNDKPLPANVPSDGIVSFSIEGKEDVDKNYLRAIGYPVYGPRACRVDMLDRVVCAIYDNAKEGKFQAQHQMAEWLGSNIADLYAIIEAMGHKKINDPAVIAIKEEPEKVVPQEQGESAMTSEPDQIEKVQDDTPKDTNQAKPELATFALKRGKASQANAQPRAAAKPNTKFKNKEFTNPDKVSFKDKNKKPFNKKDHKQSKGKPEERERIYKAEAKTNPADSPFAILGQLKVANKDD
ncbi:MAG: hypothetical protein GW903_04990 [Alphaproteobacteria bacterium]|nr:hypothetical protein [Alphaproteobacteria bacterium]NCQ88326.1 hypothetical protein [Alphaproteobacteria bacterium]NCT05150.1 hypothetical protein [Alphaproteobacteria bacterium]